jgi:phosphoribosylglycinamide formyltransferase-1
VKPNKFNLAIFASGSGTNAENIAKYFFGHQTISVAKILSNNSEAFVLERAINLGINASTFNKDEFKSVAFLERLENIDYIILAGFLWLIPAYLIESFPNRIINIHPALLPKYGGKGMYGSKVHESVVAANEKESGITIHLVNEEYDKGRILFQAKCSLEDRETPDSLATKIHSLEYEHFPKEIEKFILS